MHIRGLKAFPLLAALALVAACATRPDAATPTPSTLNPPASTRALPPTPDLSFEILDLTLRPGAEPGQQVVFGMIKNASAFAIQNVQIGITLSGPGGGSLAQGLARPLFDRLASGETSPFMAIFDGFGQAAGVTAGPVTAERAFFTRGDLEIDPPEPFLTPEGQLALQGQLTNNSAQFQALHNLGFLGVDRQARILGLATQRYGLTLLAPGQTAPYLALSPTDPGEVRWIPFQDSVVAPEAAPPELAFADEPVLRFTQQGHPFVVGSLRNQGERHRLAAVLLILSAGEQVVGISEVVNAFPLGPGQVLAFGQAEFPGLDRRLADLQLQSGDLSVSALIDPGRSLPAPDHSSQLQLQITSFEPVGSSLFLRGSVTNSESISLSFPTIFAAVRSTAGGLVTAGWSELSRRIAAGESLGFVLDLPLPDGVDTTDLEFDLLGLALGP